MKGSSGHPRHRPRIPQPDGRITSSLPKLARPGRLETNRAAGSFMLVPGYGFLNSLPGGPHGGMPPPISEWDGWRRIKLSKLQKVVDQEWASWSLPGVVCYGDSGAPTLFSPDPFASRWHDRMVAVVSDGGLDRRRAFTAALSRGITEGAAALRLFDGEPVDLDVEAVADTQPGDTDDVDRLGGLRGDRLAVHRERDRVAANANRQRIGLAALRIRLLNRRVIRPVACAAFAVVAPVRLRIRNLPSCRITK